MPSSKSLCLGMLEQKQHVVRYLRWNLCMIIFNVFITFSYNVTSCVEKVKVYWTIPNRYGEDDKCKFCIAVDCLVVVCAFPHMQKLMAYQIKQQRCTYLLYLWAALADHFPTIETFLNDTQSWFNSQHTNHL